MDKYDEETLDRYFNWDFTVDEIGRFRVLIKVVETGLRSKWENSEYYISQKGLDTLRYMLFLMENQWGNNANS